MCVFPGVSGLKVKAASTRVVKQSISVAAFGDSSVPRPLPQCMWLNRAARMVVRHHVKSWEDFTKLAESLQGKGEPVHVLFTGDKDEQGNSWCPYCVKGELHVWGTVLING